MTRTETLTLQRAINASSGWGLKEDGIYGPLTADAYQYYINQQTPRNVPTPVPEGAKPWYLSRSIIGILVSAVATLAQLLGWTVDANAATEIIIQILEVGGLALAFIGTVRRRAPIDGSLVAFGVRLPSSAPDVPADRTAARPPGPFDL